MKRVTIFLALLASPNVAMAQATPGTNLSVDIRVVEAVRRGDTIRVSYVLHNSSASREGLWEFTVAAPAPVSRLVVPEPREKWTNAVRYAGRSVASWAMLEDPYIAPGFSSPVLWFEAVGLPGLVTSWVGGWFPLPEHKPDTTDVAPPTANPEPIDVLDAHSVRGITLGVEPFPVGVSPSVLLDRVQAFLPQLCGDLAWITNQGICNSLHVKLRNAQRSVTSANQEAARGQLAAFLNELEAQRGKHVTDSAYWLLKMNAEIVLERL
jgi:hypothetical protein